MYPQKTREELEAAAQDCLRDPELTYVYQLAESAAARVFYRLHRNTHTPDFDDAVQEAAITFWQAYQKKGRADYAYAAARNQAFQSVVRRPSVPFPLSLDTDTPGDGGDTWDELIAAPPADDWTDADWISDADLGATLEKAQLAAGRQLRPTTTKTKVELVKLLMRGYDKRAIATELGLAPITVNQLRRDIRRHLVTYCQQIGIDPPDPTVHTTGWEPGTWRKPIGKRRSPRPKTAAT